MATAGQDEIVIVLECLPDEKMLPKDIFTHLQTVYDDASKGQYTQYWIYLEMILKCMLFLCKWNLLLSAYF